MKKIPTLFERVYEKGKPSIVIDKVKPGLEWVLNGEGIATVKWDGTCCAIIDGAFYKRYEAKRGRKPPEGAIPCCDPDPITGHWPHWVKVDWDNSADKWFVQAYKNSYCLTDATYEALGPHFQGNPYGFNQDVLFRHGLDELDISDRSYNGLCSFLMDNEIEGIVFWKDGEPKCKIKRTDFGLSWPVRK